MTMTANPNVRAISPERTLSDLLIVFFTLSKKEPLTKKRLNQLTQTIGNVNYKAVRHHFSYPARSTYWSNLDIQKKFILAGLYCDLIYLQGAERILAFTIRFPKGSAITENQRKHLCQTIVKKLKPFLRTNPEVLLSWERSKESEKGQYDAVHIHGTAILDLPQIDPEENYDEVKEALSSLKKTGWHVAGTDTYAGIRWCAGYLLKTQFDDHIEPVEAPTYLSHGFRKVLRENLVPQMFDSEKLYEKRDLITKSPIAKMFANHT